MKRLCLVLMGILLCSVCVAGKKAGHAKGPKGNNGRALGHTKKAVVLADHDRHVLAVYVLYKLKLGVKGDALSAAIAAKLVEIKAARSAGKNLDPGKTLRGFSHGLEKDDLNGLGAFVATKHGEGLKGDLLSKAVNAEAKKRHEFRKEARAKAAKVKGPKGKKK